jgi:hypothetical protein
MRLETCSECEKPLDWTKEKYVASEDGDNLFHFPQCYEAHGNKKRRPATGADEGPAKRRRGHLTLVHSV